MNGTMRGSESELCVRQNIVTINEWNYPFKISLSNILDRNGKRKYCPKYLN
jgi:hypothetical protein